MSNSNVCKIMEQAHIYSESNLYDKCLNFIFVNGADVIRTHAFNDLCEECVGAIVRSDELQAQEELIFEAMIVWSTSGCRRRKMSPTDVNRRTALGPLLYLIRFPTMTVTYFTQKVSFRDILSHDEAVSIYQYFHGEDRKLSKLFNKNERNRLKSKSRPTEKKSNVRQKEYIPLVLEVSPRRRMGIKPYIPLPSPNSPNISRAARFRTYDGHWKQNGPPDAISFSCSYPIVLYGIEVFGAAKGAETYNITMYLYDDMKEEVRKNDSRITTEHIRRTYDIIYSRPIRVPPNRVFTVLVELKGSPTNKGVDGSANHVVDGVTFEFSSSNRSSNGTDVTVGQIPSLLFSKTE